jgi:hypothetical protein
VRLIEAGGYGRCVDCRQSILASRLHACPFAVRCRACQEAVERQADAPRRPPVAPSTSRWSPREPEPRLRRGLMGGRGELAVVTKRPGEPRVRRPLERRP